MLPKFPSGPLQVDPVLQRIFERQHNNQLASKKQTGGEWPVDKRQWGIKRQRLDVKWTRGGGVNVTASRQTRGKQEGTAPQELAGLPRGQEVAAAAQ